MIKTSKEFMEWLGLKVGDKIRINDKPDNYIIELNECSIPCVKDEYTKIRFEMTYLINRKVEILPQPKRVGNLKCSNEIGCIECPLKILCSRDLLDFRFVGSLYSILEKFKEDETCFDQEIYDILKARLDKEVEE